MATNPIFKFEEAQRIQCKASICIEGLSGRGKSGLALILGYYLSGEDWTKVFDVDTENKSVNLFRDIPASIGNAFGAFKVGQLTADVGFKPSHYLAYRDVAIQNGAKTVIFDSISHAWQQKGGVLDILNSVIEKDPRKDSYRAWGNKTVSDEKLNLLDLYRHPKVHMITTVRVKEKLEYDKDESGKTKLVSLGDQQIQQADMKYEPDLVLRMISPGSKSKHPVAEIAKSRYAILEQGQEYEFTPALCKQLASYLEKGTSPDEILEQQRQEYIKAIKEYLDTKSTALPIWQVMKKDAGYEKTPLEDMPLNIMKSLFIKLTMD